MRKSLALLAGLCALGLAVLAWTTLGLDRLFVERGAEEARAPVALEAGVPAAVPAPAQEEALDAGEPQASGDAESPSAERDRVEPVEDADELAEERARRAREGPPAVLAGTVVSPSGEPIEGALVLARALVRASADPAPERAGLEAEARRVQRELARLGYAGEAPPAPEPGTQPAWPLDAPAWRALGLVPLEARTDAEGRFAIEGLAPGPLRLAVRAADRAPLDRDDLRLAGAGTTDVGALELGLTRRVALLLTAEDGALELDSARAEHTALLDAAGRPLAGARLYGLEPDAPPEMPGSTGRPLGISDAAGRFELELGPAALSLVVETPGRAALRFDGLVPAGLEPLRVDLELPAGVELDVRVEAGPREHQAPGDARALHLWPAAFVDRPVHGGLPPLGALVVPLPRGAERVRLRHLAAGEAYVARVLSAGVPFLSEDAWSPPVLVPLSARGAEEPLFVHYLESAAVLVPPLPGLRVELERASAPARVELSDEALLVSGLRPARGDVLYMRLLAPGFEPRYLPLSRLRPGELREVMPDEPRPAEALSFDVRDARSGRPIEDARVVQSLAGLDVFLSAFETRTDARGHARLSPGASGAQRVAVVAAGYAPAILDQPAPGMAHAVRLERGAEVAILALDGDGGALPALTVLAEPADPRLALALGEEGAIRRAVTDVEGRARFTGLAPGRHRISMARSQSVGSDSSWTMVDLTDGEKRAIVLADDPWGALSCVVSSDRGALAGARVVLEPFDRDARAGPDGPSPAPTFWTDALGRFEARWLATGLWSAAIHASEWALPAHVTLRVRPGRLETVLEPERALLYGRVLAPGGEPVAGARVELSTSEVERVPSLRGRSIFEPPGREPRAWTDAGGAFELAGLDPGRRYWVEARAEAGWKRVRVDAWRGARPLELTLEPWGEVALASEGLDEPSWMWLSSDVDEPVIVPLGTAPEERTLAFPPGPLWSALLALDGFGRVSGWARTHRTRLAPGERETLSVP